MLVTASTTLFPIGMSYRNPFDAIDDAILEVHPDANLLYFAGAKERTYTLNGVVAARLEKPTAHWLVVSQGFTELWEKMTTNPEQSGFGFELTCRVLARSSDPNFGWVLEWMQDIADYLDASGSFLATFHHKEMMKGEGITSLLFIDDVELAPTESTHGHFGFLQLVGLTSDELLAMQQWDPRKFLPLLTSRDPRLIVDTERESFLRDPEIARSVEMGSERDGSSWGASRTAVRWTAHGKELRVHFGLEAISVLEHAVRRRLPFGNVMLLVGDLGKNGALVRLEPGPLDWHIAAVDNASCAVLSLDEPLCRELLPLLGRTHASSGPAELLWEGAGGARIHLVFDQAFQMKRA